jgi:hypothetical protein
LNSDARILWRSGRYDKNACCESSESVRIQRLLEEAFHIFRVSEIRMHRDALAAGCLNFPYCFLGLGGIPVSPHVTGVSAMWLVVKGLLNKQVAVELGTVKIQRGEVMRKIASRVARGPWSGMAEKLVPIAEKQRRSGKAACCRFAPQF